MDETDSIPERKNALRRDMLEWRKALKTHDREAASYALRDVFLREFTLPAGVTVSGYWPIGSEMDVRPLMMALHEQGVSLALPVVAAHATPLIFRRWSPDDAMSFGPLNIPIPGSKSPEVIPDYVLTPLLAFDEYGHRLGYGSGFFDRTFGQFRAANHNVTAVGLCFAGQQIEKIPTDEFDQTLDVILTEKFILRPNEK